MMEHHKDYERANQLSEDVQSYYDDFVDNFVVKIAISQMTQVSP